MAALKFLLALFSFISFGIKFAPLNEDQKILINKRLFQKISETSNFSYMEFNNFVVIDGLENTEFQRRMLAHSSHELGICGGYTIESESRILEIDHNISLRKENALLFSQEMSKPRSNVDLTDIFSLFRETNLKDTVLFLEKQGTRSAILPEPNRSIDNFQQLIEETLVASNIEYEIDQISHERTKQNSIRVRVFGGDPELGTIVLGGHIDSIGGIFGTEAPGADDNASGSSVILEVLRVVTLLEASPKKNLEFIWYAGEEQGLLGSKEIARDYKSKNIKVDAVMQLDMVMHPGNGNKIGLVDDYTDPGLNDFVEELVGEYLGLEVERFECGYACSDHASWFEQGFSASAPFEATINTINPRIHTNRDKFKNGLSSEHGLHFAKLALAFVYLLGF